MTLNALPALCALAAVFAPAAAFGHTGHGATDGFAAGFLHPFAGLDHLAAMVAVGLWAARAGARALILLPAAFLVTMAVGAALAFQGIGLLAVELALASSVVALGLLVALEVRVPLVAAVTLVAAFALFHGHAHGSEMASSMSALAYGAGFLVATAVLHGAGVVAGRAVAPVALRIGGGAVAAFGLLIAAS